MCSVLSLKCFSSENASPCLWLSVDKWEIASLSELLTGFVGSVSTMSHVVPIVVDDTDFTASGWSGLSAISCMRGEDALRYGVEPAGGESDVSVLGWHKRFEAAGDLKNRLDRFSLSRRLELI